MLGFYAFFLLSLCNLNVAQYSSSFNTTTELPLSSEPCLKRSPPIWPLRLTLVQRRIPRSKSNVDIATTVTFYDWEKGVNLIQIFSDNGKVIWDLELNNHTSFYFEPSISECRVIQFEVGILRPNWLTNAEPLGESIGWDGKPVCGWTKGPNFIDYFEDKGM